MCIGSCRTSREFENPMFSHKVTGQDFARPTGREEMHEGTAGDWDGGGNTRCTSV
jgi:hypothetical protein